MRIKERYKKVFDWFQENAQSAETELDYGDHYQLLVAVILSAQCTDKRVNLITPALFENFPTPEVLAAASVEEVYEYVKSCSYPNSKAKHLVGMANKLVDEFNSEIPATMKELLTLPGVGRKTANVILSVAFDQPAMAVDTHVFRVAERIGLTYRAKTPLDSEKQLMRHIPEHLVARAHHWLILHGRYICTARSPKCDQCGLKEWCRYYKQVVSKQLPTQPK